MPGRSGMALAPSGPSRAPPGPSRLTPVGLGGDARQGPGGSASGHLLGLLLLIAPLNGLRHTLLHLVLAPMLCVHRDGVGGELIFALTRLPAAAVPHHQSLGPLRLPGGPKPPRDGMRGRDQESILVHDRYSFPALSLCEKGRKRHSTRTSSSCESRK